MLRNLNRVPLLAEAYTALPLAVTLAMAALVLVLDDADVVDAGEVADLLRTEPPMHPDPLAQELALEMVTALARALDGPRERDGEG
ncbi:hypothetical protein [Roseomonas sp. BN140053]|uniref:hypothetical protein n=1 Tax=Roseomonas sp. BN140053 TaxID=3391898 RepID=UPI0039ED7545